MLKKEKKCENESFLKGKSGITLIALVITIIVLLILAGISISSIIGENGIVGKTQKAKIETRIGKIKEERDLWLADVDMDKQLNRNDAETLEELLNRLENENIISLEERKQIEINGYFTINSEDIIFISNGIESQEVIVTSSDDEILFKNTIKEINIVNEKEDYNNYQIMGISLDKDGEYITTGKLSGKSGDLEIIGDINDTNFKYILNNFMKGDEIFYCKVLIDEEEYLQELKVIQGDVVTYQEDFVGITYVGTTWNDEVDLDEKYIDGKAKYANTTTSSARIEFDYIGSNIELYLKTTPTTGYLQILFYKSGEEIPITSYRATDTDDGGEYVVNILEGLTDELENILYNVKITQGKESNVIYGHDFYVDAIKIYR